MTATDYYSQCEAACMIKLRTLSALFPNPWQVSDDVENIRRGGNYFSIFFPSSFQTVRVDGREKAVIWNIVFDLYVRYSNHNVSLSRFKAARAEVFYLFNSDPLLNKTPNVSNVGISASGEVLQDIQGDNPNFIIQTLTVAVSQRIRFGF